MRCLDALEMRLFLGVTRKHVESNAPLRARR